MTDKLKHGPEHEEEITALALATLQAANEQATKLGICTDCLLLEMTDAMIQIMVRNFGVLGGTTSIMHMMKAAVADNDPSSEVSMEVVDLNGPISPTKH